MRPILLIAATALTACNGEGDPVELAIPFTALVNGQTAACGVEYTVGTGDSIAELGDARMLVSRVQARDDEGVWVDMTLDSSDWQNGEVALLDFEDGTAGCADSGTAETNNVITGTLPDGEYNALRFDVGVPFESNHLDSATAPAPLNAPGMFWTWQGGYKFLRVDWVVDDVVPTRWNVHVGSTGCVSDGATIAPDSECSSPNRSTVTFTDVDPFIATFDIELAELIATVDVSENTAETAPGCMSSPMEPADCAPAFGSLGLSFETGACVDDCNGQRLFHAMVEAE